MRHRDIFASACLKKIRETGMCILNEVIDRSIRSFVDLTVSGHSFLIALRVGQVLPIGE